MFIFFFIVVVYDDAIKATFFMLRNVIKQCIFMSVIKLNGALEV